MNIDGDAFVASRRRIFRRRYPASSGLVNLGRTEIAPNPPWMAIFARDRSYHHDTVYECLLTIRFVRTSQWSSCGRVVVRKSTRVPSQSLPAARATLDAYLGLRGLKSIWLFSKAWSILLTPFIVWQGSWSSPRSEWGGWKHSSSTRIW
jgi:hypothetical protein